MILLMKNERIKYFWNGMARGQPVKLNRNVYNRMDGSPYGGIYYEEPGHLIAERGWIGRFVAKTSKGVLVEFRTQTGAVLGLVLDEFAIERYVANTGA
jgi:hypothetical protein